MRIRHAMAAGTAVSLLSAATSLMASASASAHTTASLAAPAPHAMQATTAAGSAAGLVLGLLAVIGVAGVSLVVRVGAGRPNARTQRVVNLPSTLVARPLAPAYAE